MDDDLGLVYATTGNNYTDAPGPTSDSIFALDLQTGALRWTRQVSQGDLFTLPAPRGPDSDFGTNRDRATSLYSWMYRGQFGKTSVAATRTTS